MAVDRMTRINVDSYCWPSVEVVIAQRIEELRSDLETAPPSLPDMVARTQGEIAGLRWLLDAANRQQPQQENA